VRRSTVVAAKDAQLEVSDQAAMARLMGASPCPAGPRAGSHRSHARARADGSARPPGNSLRAWNTSYDVARAAREAAQGQVAFAAVMQLQGAQGAQGAAEAAAAAAGAQALLPSPSQLGSPDAGAAAAAAGGIPPLLWGGGGGEDGGYGGGYEGGGGTQLALPPQAVGAVRRNPRVDTLLAAAAAKRAAAAAKKAGGRIVGGIFVTNKKKAGRPSGWTLRDPTLQKLSQAEFDQLPTEALQSLFTDYYECADESRSSLASKSGNRQYLKRKLVAHADEASTYTSAGAAAAASSD